jgi:hypothetical protein
LADRCGSELTLVSLSKSDGWGETMDVILELAIEDDVERLCVLDDDLAFSARDPATGFMSLKSVSGRELGEYLQQGLNLVRPECPHLGVPQVYNRTHDRVLHFCAPAIAVHFLYVPHFVAHPEHRFACSGMRAYTDFRIALLELTSGFLNGLMTTLIVTNDFNAPGGSSVYRSAARQWAGAKRLARDFPDVVLLRRREGYGADKDAVLEKPSVRWRQALNREAFVERFKQDPSAFASKMLARFESDFTEMVRRVR